MIGTEGKRPRLETYTSTSMSATWSRSDEQVDRLPNKIVSSAQPDAFAISHHRAAVIPPIGPLRIPSRPSYPLLSTTLTAYSLSGPNSPRMGDHYPPFTLPRSITHRKENSFDFHTSAMAHDARRHTDPNMPYPSTSYSQPIHHTSSITLPTAYGSHYQAPVDLPSRTSFREPARLPQLTHEHTTLSSSGGNGGYKTAFSGPLLLVIDAQKSTRMLPQPIPSVGAKPSLLDRSPLPASSSASTLQQHSNFWINSSLAPLPRPGVLAREVNEEETGRRSSYELLFHPYSTP